MTSILTYHNASMIYHKAAQPPNPTDRLRRGYTNFLGRAGVMVIEVTVQKPAVPDVHH